MALPKIIRNPVVHKRIRRFKELKRAYYSFWILILLYVVSLFSNIICNDKPLYIRFKGHAYFPILQYYSERTFIPNGRKTRPDYRRLAQSPLFTDHAENYMVFPPSHYGPYESMDPATIELASQVQVRFRRVALIGSVDVIPDDHIVKAVQFGGFINRSDTGVIGGDIQSFMPLSGDLQAAIRRRFDNAACPAFSEVLPDFNGRSVEVWMPAFTPRSIAPLTVRLRLREVESAHNKEKSAHLRLVMDRQAKMVAEKTSASGNELWASLGAEAQEKIRQAVRQRYQRPIESFALQVERDRYQISFFKEDVRFPFHPFKGHFMGVDGAGRDVFARILYGLRTSMSFGLLLVALTMTLGVTAGALQGYYGGTLDLTAQRLIEVWSALPFLYIMILMGSVFGRSFSLLLFCYGIFNWIGISYYARAEFLSLRTRPFVEAAKCLGVPSYKIIFRHILPNSLTPIVTFFPFSLVGAIGSLAVLDYLGFGLPAPTSSWGELLYQAQQYRWAWWLILYPSLALFIVMLLGVFVGEGFRNAYDPKRYSRLE
jgi:microcin C transport system permease protein